MSTYHGRYTVVKGKSLHLVEGPNCSWPSTYTSQHWATMVSAGTDCTLLCLDCFRVDADPPLTWIANNRPTSYVRYY